MSDFWREWEQRNVVSQAQAEIARKDDEFRRWEMQTQLEIEYYAMTNPAMAEQYRARYQQMAELHATRIALIEQDAQQQLAEIDTRYTTEAAQREREDADLRDRWANTPGATPRPAWDDGYTPAAPYAYGSPHEQGSFAPDPALPPEWHPDAHVDDADQPEHGSLVDRLLGWFR